MKNAWESNTEVMLCGTGANVVGKYKSNMPYVTEDTEKLCVLIHIGSYP